MKILIAENDPAISDVLLDYLRSVKDLDKIRTETTVVTSTDEAYDQLEHADLLIIDIDGIKAIVAQKALCHQLIPVIVISSRFMPYDRIPEYRMPLRLIEKSRLSLSNFRMAMRDFEDISSTVALAE